MSGRTRSATKSKIASSTKKPVMRSERNSSANNSYITIVSNDIFDNNTDTLDNINIDLRNRLAEKESVLESKELENSQLRTN